MRQQMLHMAILRLVLLLTMAHAKGMAAKNIENAQHAEDKLVDKLVDKLASRWHLQRADLDNKTLAAVAADVSRSRFPTRAHLKKFQEIFITQYLPLALTTSIVFGLTVPSLGQELMSWTVGTWTMVPTICVTYIFFFAGANLKMGEVKKAFQAIWTLIYGVVTINFITPFLSIPVSKLPFLSPELRQGFVLFCNMATSLNAGVAMARQAKADVAFALLLVCMTNIIGIFTVPFYLSKLMAGVGNVHIDPVPILVNLCLTVLLPVIVGQGFRYLPGVAAFLDKYSIPVTISTNTVFAMIPGLTVSKSSANIKGLGAKTILGQIVPIALCIHFCFLAWNFVLSGLLQKFLGYRMGIRKSLLLLCSQKNLPVGMAILAFLPAAIGDHGTIAIPCILSHFSQLIVDSLLVPKLAVWKSKFDRELQSSSSSGAATTDKGKLAVEEGKAAGWRKSLRKIR